MPGAPHYSITKSIPVIFTRYDKFVCGFIYNAHFVIFIYPAIRSETGICSERNHNLTRCIQYCEISIGIRNFKAQLIIRFVIVYGVYVGIFTWKYLGSVEFYHAV